MWMIMLTILNIYCQIIYVTFKAEEMLFGSVLLYRLELLLGGVITLVAIILMSYLLGMFNN